MSEEEQLRVGTHVLRLGLAVVGILLRQDASLGVDHEVVQSLSLAIHSSCSDAAHQPTHVRIHLPVKVYPFLLTKV